MNERLSTPTEQISQPSHQPNAKDFERTGISERTTHERSRTVPANRGVRPPLPNIPSKEIITPTREKGLLGCDLKYFSERFREKRKRTLTSTEAGINNILYKEKGLHQ